MPPPFVGAHIWSEIPQREVAVEDARWSPRFELNRTHAILYQWEQYERWGTIDNFRVLAGLVKGERRGSTRRFGANFLGQALSHVARSRAASFGTGRCRPHR